MSYDQALIIIAKYPERGKVKTRIKGLTDISRVSLYEQLLNDTVKKLGRISGIDTFIAFAPKHAESYFRQFNVGLIPLHEGDLGIRMFEAFAYIFDMGYSKSVLVGADIPSLTPRVIKEALMVLRDNDLVYGPAEDGGYYLVGMRKLIKDVFIDVPWSSDKTLECSLKQAENAGYSVGYTEMLFDIDRIEDLQRIGYIK